MGKVSKIKAFFKSCLFFIPDKDDIVALIALIEETRDELRPYRRVNHVEKRLNIGFEIRMTAQIGDYDMDYISLEMGSDVNILIRHRWESMGKLKLDWSPIQFMLAN